MKRLKNVYTRNGLLIKENIFILFKCFSAFEKDKNRLVGYRGLCFQVQLENSEIKYSYLEGFALVLGKTKTALRKEIKEFCEECDASLKILYPSYIEIDHISYLAINNKFRGEII